MNRTPDQIGILKLIPQRAPMVMVDRLVHVGDRTATSEFEVTNENIFVEKGLFREEGVLENIAQTAAALNGYRSLSEGSRVSNGYIGGVKNLEVLSLPGVGETITTRVIETHRVLDAGILSGESRVGDRVVARCELKVFTPQL